MRDELEELRREFGEREREWREERPKLRNCIRVLEDKVHRLEGKKIEGLGSKKMEEGERKWRVWERG